jgi:hypothetical protein
MRCRTRVRGDLPLRPGARKDAGTGPAMHRPGRALAKQGCGRTVLAFAGLSLTAGSS